MIALLVITDGRKDCLIETIASAMDNLDGPITERWMYDDSGDPEHRAWLRKSYPQFNVMWHIEGRQGFGGAIRAAWHTLRLSSKADYIFHLEDDFTFNRPVPLNDMIDALDENDYLAQIALLRQPWNDTERAAGGIVQSNPCAYIERSHAGPHGHDYAFLEHRLFFTTNPSLYRRSLLDHEWPLVEHSEGMYSIALLELGYRFAFLGDFDTDPWVHHIGTNRAGTGY